MPLEVMMDDDRMDGLHGAIQAVGGLRSVARRSQIDASNLQKYIRFGRGLSDKNIESLYTTLGRIDGHIPDNSVVVLRPKWINVELAYALSWYFPSGGEVARATWSGMGWEHIKKVLTLDATPGIYAIRSPHGERAVILLPASLLFPRKLFPQICPELHWRGGEPERAELQFDNADPWISGNVTSALFDEAWPDGSFDPTAEDLLQYVRQLKLTWAEAIRRVAFNA